MGGNAVMADAPITTTRESKSDVPKRCRSPHQIDSERGVLGPFGLRTPRRHPHARQLEDLPFLARRPAGFRSLSRREAALGRPGCIGAVGGLLWRSYRSEV